MFRPAFRIATSSAGARVAPRAHAARRFVSTAPPHQKSRSWRSSAARWSLAGALVYYYNTATVFAEEPQYAIHAPPEASRETETYPTVASVSEQRRAQARTQAALPSKESQSAAVAASADAGQMPPTEAELDTGAQALEEEASEQGAFNEETGEINWDCPCLGGMAYGPCGEQFRAAFSCFVFSKEEPKGVDCIEHFKTMQNCFREHPDVYGSELEDDDASAEGVEGAAIDEQTPAEPVPAPMPGVGVQPDAAGPEKAPSTLNVTQESQQSQPPPEKQQSIQSPAERSEARNTNEDTPED